MGKNASLRLVVKLCACKWWRAWVLLTVICVQSWHNYSSQFCEPKDKICPVTLCHQFCAQRWGTMPPVQKWCHIGKFYTSEENKFAVFTASVLVRWNKTRSAACRRYLEKGLIQRIFTNVIRTSRKTDWFPSQKKRCLERTVIIRCDNSVEQISREGGSVGQVLCDKWGNEFIYHVPVRLKLMYE